MAFKLLNTRYRPLLQSSQSPSFQLSTFIPSSLPCWNTQPLQIRTRWWFQILFIFRNIWWNDPIWLAHIFPRGGSIQPPTTRETSAGLDDQLVARTQTSRFERWREAPLGELGCAGDPKKPDQPCLPFVWRWLDDDDSSGWFDEFVLQKANQTHTPPKTSQKTHLEHENDGFQKESSLPGVPTIRFHVSFRGGKIDKKPAMLHWGRASPCPFAMLWEWVKVEISSLSTPFHGYCQWVCWF